MMTNSNHINTKNTDKYKILYVGNFVHRSVGEPEIAKALEKLGHTVTRLQLGTTSADKIEYQAKKHDFLLCSKFHTGIASLDKKLMSDGPIPTVCWVFDLYWNFRHSGLISSEPHFHANLVFSTDGGHEQEWKDAGIEHHLLRQGISDDVKKGEKIDLGQVEIGFIGTVDKDIWPYRAELVKFLKETYGPKFKHFGEDGRLRHEELNNVLASLKIVIGDSVHSPYYWSNRLYEMIGRGAFLIRPNIEGIHSEFLPYKHFIPYNYGSFKTLKEKIDYYLEHDAEREKIREAGFKHCHENHTYTHRAKELIKVIEKCLLKKNQ